MEIRRGDVLYADLGSFANDCVQRGRRPVAVVSNDKSNCYSSVITVVPLTSKVDKKRNLPTHVFIDARENQGIDRHSLALCEQVTALGKNKILDFHYGRLNEEVMEEITRALQIHLGRGRACDG